MPLLRLILMLLVVAAQTASADTAEVIDRHILPRHAAFAASTARLAAAARDSCAPARLIPLFHAAYDDWMGVQHIRTGPVEDEGRGLAIAYWPDPKGLGLRVQRALIYGDAEVLDPAAFARQSVAARGLTGLERLLFPATPWPADTCPLIRATTADLARLAAELEDGWRNEFGPLLRHPGAAGNTRFLNRAEPRQMLFTQIVTGLDFVKDQRLGRPLGSFDRPAPERAEARASGRSLRNVTLSLRALRGMVSDLSGQAPRTQAALDRAIALAEALPDPVLAGTATPQGWLKVQIVQQAVEAARDTAVAELGPALGVSVGFNAMDGD